MSPYSIPSRPEWENGREEAPEEKECQARALCSCNDYHEILSELKERALLQSQENRLDRIYGKRLEKAEFLTDADWEMLTILELYDPETFNHSLRVFETVYEKMQGNHPIGFFLRTHLAQEGISGKDLLRAALLHDIGKVTIPKEILNDMTTDEEWMILAKISLHPKRYEEIAQQIAGNPHLAKDYIPFSCVIPESLAESLRDRGIDPNQPLGVIIGKHPHDSGEILRSYGFTLSAEIAESHHNRPIGEEHRPISISSLRAGWILRAADIFDAMRSPRAYKPGASLQHAIDILREAADRGFIDRKVAELFIDHELENQRRPGYTDILAGYPVSDSPIHRAPTSVPRHNFSTERYQS